MCQNAEYLVKVKYLKLRVKACVSLFCILTAWIIYLHMLKNSECWGKKTSQVLITAIDLFSNVNNVSNKNDIMITACYCIFWNYLSMCLHSKWLIMSLCNNLSFKLFHVLEIAVKYCHSLFKFYTTVLSLFMANMFYWVQSDFISD